ncbi:DVU0298 family protein [Desulfovibrio inopinatus]|uniref:DVU0298 family protein n=1 Tax=Desulfovibrio inopinatus TaxID=102109 RepID=UPI00040226BF|nr:DVU0298 family protein [Desulfovibrio inopinatus]
MARMRALRSKTRDILAAADWESRLSELLVLPAKTVLGPLFGALLDKEELVRWHAVTAFGVVVPPMADARMEDGRILMRRLMWNLNEESGNIGWGIPETFGEILACHEGLALEFHRILISYIQENACSSNYIDHCPLRQCAYWGIGRLAQARPELARHGQRDVIDGLQNDDAVTRGLCAWTVSLLGPVEDPDARGYLDALCNDQNAVRLYRNRCLEDTTVAQLAQEALKAIS